MALLIAQFISGCTLRFRSSLVSVSCPHSEQSSTPAMTMPSLGQILKQLISSSLSPTGRDRESERQLQLLCDPPWNNSSIWNYCTHNNIEILRYSWHLIDSIGQAKCRCACWINLKCTAQNGELTQLWFSFKTDVWLFVCACVNAQKCAMI